MKDLPLVFVYSNINNPWTCSIILWETKTNISTNTHTHLSEKN